MSKRIRNNKKNQQNQGKVLNGVFLYSGNITLDQLCRQTGISATDTIKEYLLKGQRISLNSVLTDDRVGEICLNNNLDVKRQEDAIGDDFTKRPIFDRDIDKDPRSPIVTIRGHVDHGKTTLIDSIRHSNITGKEHGGITQEIGAYQKIVDGKKITFIDTPGHEAFSARRARGARVTDIVILVVAADDGVKPQTVEAIDHAKAAKVPIIVAINKRDKPGANPEKVRQQLASLDVVSEKWGGDTMRFEISAKQNKGIDKLLEGVLDLAERLDLKSTIKKEAVGTVIEAELDKKEGPKATLLVQNGTLHIGDYLAVGQFYCKVRKMVNEFNQGRKEALPSTPVSVTGLSGVPVAGDRFRAFENEQEAKSAAARRAQKRIGKNNGDVSLATVAANASNGERPQLNLIVKADTQGSAEALKSSLTKIDVPGTKLTIVHTASGEVNQSDITLASASHSVILAFDIKVSSAIKDRAKENHVEIREYNIIYKLLEDIESALKGKLGPVYHEVVYGHAEVRSLFKASHVGQILGLFVTDGKITAKSEIRVFRNKELILKTHITSLKRFKDDAKEVLAGFECGATISDKFDLQQGDVLEAYGQEEVKNG